MATYRRKPQTVEAIQWTGENPGEAEAFAGEAFNGCGPDDSLYLCAVDDPNEAEVGDYLVRDLGLRVFGQAAFERDYEPADTLDALAQRRHVDAAKLCDTLTAELSRARAECYQFRAELAAAKREVAHWKRRYVERDHLRVQRNHLRDELAAVKEAVVPSAQVLSGLELFRDVFEALRWGTTAPRPPSAEEASAWLDHQRRRHRLGGAGATKVARRDARSGAADAEPADASPGAERKVTWRVPV